MTSNKDRHDPYIGGLILVPNTDIIDEERRKKLELNRQHICITRCNWRPPLRFYNGFIVPARRGTAQNPYYPKWRYVKVHEPGKCKCKAAGTEFGDGVDDHQVNGGSKSKKLSEIVAIWGNDGPGGEKKEDNEVFSEMMEWQAELVS